MGNFKSKNTGEEITESQYNYLRSSEKSNYAEVDENGDFLTSMAIGMATDNALLGGLLGGSMTGGIVGDMLNDGGLF